MNQLAETRAVAESLAQRRLDRIHAEVSPSIGSHERLTLGIRHQDDSPVGAIRCKPPLKTPELALADPNVSFDVKVLISRPNLGDFLRGADLGVT